MSIATHHYPVILDRTITRIAAADKPPKNAGTAASPSVSPGERLLGKRVLIVEDEALVALELRFAFEDEGAEVLGPAQSLMKALEAVTHEREIDLALLDVDLAGENVYPVAELLRQRSVPFAFHTGHASRSELGTLFPGTTTFIKPALTETLIAHMMKIGR
ncbi:MAG: response regulator [Sphingomonadales bacterium]|nr:response regulator [Sphingomonadales bacterium]